MGVGKGGMNLERYLNFCIMCSNMYARKKRITPSFFLFLLQYYIIGWGWGLVRYFIHVARYLFMVLIYLSDV